MSLVRRCSRSRVSRTSSFCSFVWSGEYPARSERWLGVLAARRNWMTCVTPLDSTRVLKHGAVFTAQLDRLLGRLAVWHGVGLDPQRAADVGLPAAQVGAVLSPDDEGLGAGGQLCGLTQAGDGADFPGAHRCGAPGGSCGCPAGLPRSRPSGCRRRRRE